MTDDLEEPRIKLRHCGKAYHEFMLSSLRDRRPRRRFQELVLRKMPPKGTVLDLGAGTGIDAKYYAANGLAVLVHEPSEINLDYLREYCREEIAAEKIAITDLVTTRNVDMIVANFAVLNLIGDHRALFRDFARVLVPGGLVLISLLNPFFLGDARYGWWRRNLRTLLANGAYTVDGKFGPIYRFAPSTVRRVARPEFTFVQRVPAWLCLATSRYFFMLLRKK